jgi:ABC-2 type transport system ATP-binding protein
VAATILTKGLTKAYEAKKVVDGLNLELSAGEIFGLLGPNGAGKTTTILMLLGLTEPTSGSARVLGLDPRRNPLEVKRRVGYLPDAVGFYDGMTGRENLRFTAELNRLDRATREAKVAEVLAEVGLSDAADQAAGTYSRGMRQRLGIADALLKEPAVLILDEPTTSIDPEGVAEILALIRRLAGDRGVTVLLSSHLLNQVQAVCDRVAIFVKGKVAAQGAPHELAIGAKGPESIELAARSDPTPVLTGARFVHTISPGRAPGTYLVTIDPGSTAELVAMLAAGGVAIEGVHRRTEDLEEIYRRQFGKEADRG